MVCDFLQKRGLQILERRMKTPFAEVDIFAYDPHEDRHTLIEVKSLSSRDWAGQRLGSKQQERLQNARVFLSEKYFKPCILLLAMVDEDANIRFIVI